MPINELQILAIRGLAFIRTISIIIICNKKIWPYNKAPE